MLLCYTVQHNKKEVAKGRMEREERQRVRPRGTK